MKRIISFSLFLFLLFQFPKLRKPGDYKVYLSGFFLSLYFIYIFWAILILRVCWKEDEKNWIIDLISSYILNISNGISLFLFLFFFGSKWRRWKSWGHFRNFGSNLVLTNEFLALTNRTIHFGPQNPRNANCGPLTQDGQNYGPQNLNDPLVFILSYQLTLYHLNFPRDSHFLKLDTSTGHTQGRHLWNTVICH